jgi:hypothetical protein
VPLTSRHRCIMLLRNVGTRVPNDIASEDVILVLKSVRTPKFYIENFRQT